MVNHFGAQTGVGEQEGGGAMRNAKASASMTSLFLANVLYWVCAGVYSPFLSAHYASLGLSAAETGI